MCIAGAMKEGHMALMGEVRALPHCIPPPFPLQPVSAAASSAPVKVASKDIAVERK